MGRHGKDAPIMKQYRCMVCDYIYDPAAGDPESGIPPGTQFEQLPQDWVCPLCQVGRSEFEAVKIELLHRVQLIASGGVGKSPFKKAGKFDG